LAATSHILSNFPYPAAASPATMTILSSVQCSRKPYYLSLLAISPCATTAQTRKRVTASLCCPKKRQQLDEQAFQQFYHETMNDRFLKFTEALVKEWELKRVKLFALVEECPCKKAA
jgi:hypothetical protein